MSVVYGGTYLYQRRPSEQAHEERVSLNVYIYILYLSEDNMCV